MAKSVKRTAFKRKTPQWQDRSKQWSGPEIKPRRPVLRVVQREVSARAPIPKPAKAKPGKRAPTKLEAAWMARIVAYGCVACRLDGLASARPAVHHILRAGRRIGHLFSLPLCDPGHHQGGDARGLVSRHPWKARFELLYGTEMELLAMLRRELGFEAQ